MKIVFLGQAGLYIETNGLKIVIDPYLSNSVEKINPKNYRRQPIAKEWLNLQPDVLIFTHDHLDHYDEETAKHFLCTEKNVTVLSPRSVWNRVRLLGNENNFVQFDVGTTWTECGVSFEAVKAEHSDEDAIGVIVTIKKKKYYITGDTLYNESVFQSLPKSKIEAVFLPINGKGNNMNVEDALRFARRVRAKYVIPVHFGMFDEMTGEELKYKTAVIPQIYKEIKLI